MPKRLLLLVMLAPFFHDSMSKARQLTEIQHVVAAIEKDRFHGWPANNGAWQWGDEFLVGFTQGDYDDTDGHNIAGIEQSKFTRSTDGGETWEMFDPENFLDDENIKWLPKGKMRLRDPIDFTNRGFAMRVFATGYHGNDDHEAGFYYSQDRGATWNGPFYFGEINQHAELKGKTLTPRTDYVVLDRQECMVFITARDDYMKTDDWADMGYPRLLQRSDGKLVAIYYWASHEHPQHYIAASIWQP